MSSSLIDANPILVDIIDHCVAPPCKYRWNGLLIAIPQKTWLINVYVWFRGISYEYICFAPKIKRKGYSQNESPYCQNESPSNRFVMHPAREVGAFSDYGILLIIDAAGIGDRATPEYCIFLGVFAVSH